MDYFEGDENSEDVQNLKTILFMFDKIVKNDENPNQYGKYVC